MSLLLLFRPSSGGAAAVAFRAAYRLYLRILGDVRTLGVSPERRTLTIAQVDRALRASPERRTLRTVGDARTLGAIS